MRVVVAGGVKGFIVKLFAIFESIYCNSHISTSTLYFVFQFLQDLARISILMPIYSFNHFLVVVVGGDGFEIYRVLGDYGFFATEGCDPSHNNLDIPTHTALFWLLLWISIGLIVIWSFWYSLGVFGALSPNILYLSLGCLKNAAHDCKLWPIHLTATPSPVQSLLYLLRLVLW